MVSFQAKTRQDKPRVIQKKKVIIPIHSKPAQNREFQKNNKKNQKIKKHHYGFIRSKKGTGQAKSDTKKKLSFRSIPTRPEIGNSKKIAKKCKKLRNNIVASFQAKTGWDRLRVIQKKKVIIPIHSNQIRNREFQKIAKKCKNLKNIIMASFQAKTVWDRMRMKQKKMLSF